MLTTRETEDAEFPSSILGATPGEMLLSIRSGDNAQVVTVEGTKISVGSDAGCTLRIQSEDVRPVECMILRGPNRTVVRSWSDRIQCNNQPLVDSVFQAGDVLSFAQIEIEYIGENRSVASDHLLAESPRNEELSEEVNLGANEASPNHLEDSISDESDYGEADDGCDFFESSIADSATEEESEPTSIENEFDFWDGETLDHVDNEGESESVFESNGESALDGRSVPGFDELFDGDQGDSQAEPTAASSEAAHADAIFDTDFLPRRNDAESESNEVAAEQEMEETTLDEDAAGSFDHDDAPTVGMVAEPETSAAKPWEYDNLDFEAAEEAAEDAGEPFSDSTDSPLADRQADLAANPANLASGERTVREPSPALDEPWDFESDASSLDQPPVETESDDQSYHAGNADPVAAEDTYEEDWSDDDSQDDEDPFETLQRNLLLAADSKSNGHGPSFAEEEHPSASGSVDEPSYDDDDSSESRYGEILTDDVAHDEPPFEEESHSPSLSDVSLEAENEAENETEYETEYETDVNLDGDFAIDEKSGASPHSADLSEQVEDVPAESYDADSFSADEATEVEVAEDSMVEPELVEDDSPEPEPVVPAEALVDDDSIEAYMQRLLHRSRGTEEIALVAKSVGKRPIFAEPKEEVDFMTSLPPAKRRMPIGDLSAMRELANETTRIAITNHAQKSRKDVTKTKLLTAIATGLGAGILLTLSGFEINLFLLAGLLLAGWSTWVAVQAVQSGVLQNHSSSKRSAKPKRGKKKRKRKSMKRREKTKSKKTV